MALGQTRTGNNPFAGVLDEVRIYRRALSASDIAAIEREMGQLREDQRAKILGLNAARIFKFDVDLLLKRRTSAKTAGH